jgi:hypothetical protein
MFNHKILKSLEHLKIPGIEHYVMVQKVMVFLKKRVNKHVQNMIISHYKMVTDKLGNVSVIMIYKMHKNMVLLIVVLQEVNGVMLFIKILIKIKTHKL